jgi:NAD-dependent dihydropyrimidine dehydrogenase PreA subunit
MVFNAVRKLRYLWTNVVETCLRTFPFRCRTGLIVVGSPGPDSPVLLTCNFHLTVERVKKALTGVDAYLLVANSRGVNVWCAATGGLLTNHDVISVLKTSGVADRVRQREIILPQLAATGVEGKVIEEKTGWTVVWGPVDAADIPVFLGNGFQKTTAMTSVVFKWPERLEMAITWAFPMSVLTLFGLPLLGRNLLPLIGLIWLLSFLIFLGFPLYQAHLQGARGVILRQFTVGVVLVGIVATMLITAAATSESLSWEWAVRWSLAALIIVSILCVEITGTTPVYKSGLHEDRLLQVSLDQDLCSGLGFCDEVCPRNVFEVKPLEQTATLAKIEDCVQCGACIVQCPVDALCFRSPSGGMVAPDMVRKFKLNLLGKRMVKADG